MQRLALALVVAWQSLALVNAQDSSGAKPYNDADAYQIYSLLLPHEESYEFAKDVLTLQETAVAIFFKG